MLEETAASSRERYLVQTKDLTVVANPKDSTKADLDDRFENTEYYKDYEEAYPDGGYENGGKQSKVKGRGYDYQDTGSQT